jgi:hypothetical protein
VELRELSAGWHGETVRRGSIVCDDLPGFELPRADTLRRPGADPSYFTRS